jgi:hypothetical protein
MAGAMAVVALLAIHASATQFDAFDRSAQVRGSDVILTGRILSVRCQWSPDHSAIFSDAELSVDEVWKGLPAGDRVVVRTFGGRVGDVALEVEGAARFDSGERVVVFLRRSGLVYSPFGMRFGKYQIVGMGAASMAIGAPPPTTKGEQTFAAASVPLARFRTEVARLVDGEDK